MLADDGHVAENCRQIAVCVACQEILSDLSGGMVHPFNSDAWLVVNAGWVQALREMIGMDQFGHTYTCPHLAGEEWARAWPQYEYARLHQHD